MTWRALRLVLWGWLVAVPLETPVLWFGLAPVHSWRQKLFAGLWLTACSYPLLVLVLPAIVDPLTQWRLYVLVGETGVATIECLLFWLAFDKGRGHPRKVLVRDALAVVLANLNSYLLVELWRALG